MDTGYNEAQPVATPFCPLLHMVGDGKDVILVGAEGYCSQFLDQVTFCNSLSTCVGCALHCEYKYPHTRIVIQKPIFSDQNDRHVHVLC